MKNENNRRREKNPTINPSDVRSFLDSLFEDDLHAKRIMSLADATLGILHSASLGVHAIGRGLAAARGLIDKHAIKQVDRLYSNLNIVVWDLFASWVPYVVGGMEDVVVNLDWTDFENDDQVMLVASIQTHHGRSIPLVWLTVCKSKLKHHTNEYEIKLLKRLKEVMPIDVKVTLVADRGFADPVTFSYITNDIKYEYIIRFKENVNITEKYGFTMPAFEYLGKNGRMRVLRDVKLTKDQYSVATVIVVKKKDMKDIWCLAASDPQIHGTVAVKRYGKRFTIEEMFRDFKDIHYGMGMSWTSIRSPERRDRMFLTATLAQSLLTLLGEAGEQTGLDRMLKANTSKKRTLSLMRQGILWYGRIPTMPKERLNILISKFSEIITSDTFFGSVFVRG